MMGQRFYASKINTFTWPNGAIGYRSGSSFDCLGPYAKVENCPIVINGIEVCRLTCYASDYADTYFSIPANTRKNGKHVKGYFALNDGNIEFMVMDSHKYIFDEVKL